MNKSRILCIILYLSLLPASVFAATNPFTIRTPDTIPNTIHAKESLSPIFYIKNNLPFSTTVKVNITQNPNNAGFVIADNRCNTIAAGGTCPIRINFAPQQKMDNASMQFVVLNGSTTYPFPPSINIKVTDPLPPPPPPPSPASVQGQVTQGLPASMTLKQNGKVAFTFTNIGESKVVQSGAVQITPVKGTFTADTNTCNNKLLAAQETCSITGKFTATTPGTGAGVTVSYPFDGKTASATATTTILTPANVQAKVTQALPTSMMLKQNEKVAFTFTNTGESKVVQSGAVQITPVKGTFTSGTNTCNNKLLTAKETCSVTGIFTATTPGADAGITVSYPYDGKAATTATTTTILPPTGGQIETNLTTLPPQSVSVTSKETYPVAFYFLNTGKTVVKPTDVQIVGFTANDNTCTNQNIGPNAKCWVKGIFTVDESKVGTYPVGVTYIYEGKQVPFMVSVDVTASDAQIEGRVSDALFGNTPIGTNTPVTFTLINRSTSEIPISKIIITGSGPAAKDAFSFPIDTCSDQVLQPNHSCSVQSTFSPTVEGAAQLTASYTYLGGKTQLSTATNVKADYLPIAIVNNTGIANPNGVYITIKASNVMEGQYNPPRAEKQCFIALDKQGKGRCVEVVAGQTSSQNYSYALATLPKEGDNYKIYLPKVISGRFYISLGDKLDMYVKEDPRTAATTILDPDGFKLRDSNYYMLYDKFEFSYNDLGTWVNPTAVDFFSLPIYLEQPGSGEFQHVGLWASRASIKTAIKTVFDQATDKTKGEWNKLFLYYPNADQSFLRLVAPGKAMMEKNAIANPEHVFDQNYLNNESQYGFSHTKKVWDFYTKNTVQNNTVQINAQEICSLYRPGGHPLCGCSLPGGKTIFTGQVDNKDQIFWFTSPDRAQGDPHDCVPRMRIAIHKPTHSTPFFAGAGEQFDTPNNTPKAIIVRQLTSAFEVGLLPALDQDGKATTNVLLDRNYFIQKRDGKKYYQDNPTWEPNTGPWYDLYAKALHSLDTDPTRPQPIYTFAYDDALAQDGTLHNPNMATDSEKMKTVTVTLGNMIGTQIPPLPSEEDGKIYANVSIEVGTGNLVKFYNAAEQVITVQGGHLSGPENIKIPMRAKFCDSNGNVQTANIYVNPALVRPIVQDADGIMIDISKNKIVFPGLPPQIQCVYH